jgi:hypothetical protein
MGRSFQGTVTFGNAIQAPQYSLNNPQWSYVTIDWNIGTATSGIEFPELTHTSDWHMPSLNSNIFKGPNPAHSSGNVHRVNASLVMSKVVRIRGRNTTQVNVDISYP